MSEYGPPIPVNGKRPDWLGIFDKFEWQQSGSFVTANYPPDAYTSGDWNAIKHIKLLASHPYYQSAEYKASVGDDGTAAVLTQAYIEHLEAKGYTVTPPDPLAADREFLAGLLGALDLFSASCLVVDRTRDHCIPAAMEYLTRWADARGNV